MKRLALILGMFTLLLVSSSNAQQRWERNYGGASADYGRSVQQTSDGGYIVAGYSTSFGNSSQVYLIKINAQGDTLWTKTHGGTDYDGGWSVQQTTDEGYIVAGGSYSSGSGDQVFLVKTNASGDTLWTRTYGGTSYDWGWSVQQTTDGGYIMTGRTYSFGNSGQVYLIKTDSSGRSTGVEEPAEGRGKWFEVRITAKPNPFTSFATLPGHEAERFSLYDVSGWKVGTFRGDRVGEGLAPGVYFLRQEGKNSAPLRIVKVR
jgi:hypothetical protein